MGQRMTDSQMKLDEEDSFVELMCGNNKAYGELATIPSEKSFPRYIVVLFSSLDWYGT